MGEETEAEVEPLSWWTYLAVGGLWYLSGLVLGQGGVEGETPHLVLAAVFIGTFGVACLVNGQRCGALHCRVSGPGYLVVAGLAILSALGLVGVGRGLIMALFGAVFVASYAMEYIAESASGPPDSSV